MATIVLKIADEHPISLRGSAAGCACGAAASDCFSLPSNPEDCFPPAL